MKDYPPYLDYPKERKTITNGDKIRQMTDEELAEFMRGCPKNSAHNMCAGEGDVCKQCWLDWLKQNETVL